jgi:hypothetical protein
LPQLSCPGRVERSETRPGTQREMCEAQYRGRRSSSCGPWVPARARVPAPCPKRRAGARAWPGHESVIGRRGSSRARRGTERVAASFLFTMSNSAVFFVPAARCCARVLLFSFPSALMRGGRSAERRSIRCRALRRATGRAYRGAARVQRDALASSALHRGDFGPGAALPSPAFPPDPCSELLAARS